MVERAGKLQPTYGKLVGFSMLVTFRDGFLLLAFKYYNVADAKCFHDLPMMTLGVGKFS